jgi:hypothetical protein
VTAHTHVADTRNTRLARACTQTLLSHKGRHDVASSHRRWTHVGRRLLLVLRLGLLLEEAAAEHLRHHQLEQRAQAVAVVLARVQAPARKARSGTQWYSTRTYIRTYVRTYVRTHMDVVKPFQPHRMTGGSARRMRRVTETRIRAYLRAAAQAIRACMISVAVVVTECVV